jgi:hypothetical protein
VKSPDHASQVRYSKRSYDFQLPSREEENFLDTPFKKSYYSQKLKRRMIRMKQDIRTMTGEDTVRYLEKKLKGKTVISVEVGDTILIKESKMSFKKWASPLWVKAKEEGLTEKDISDIIKEARNRGHSL